MEEQEYRPRRKKRRSRFVRRLRAFVRHMAELPAQTLLVIGGSIAVILIAVILLVVLLPRGEQVVDGDVNASAAPSESPALPTFTPAPTAPPTATPHPLTGIGTQGSNGWYLQLNVVDDIVADIQTRLIELGYMETPVVDGVAQVTTTYGPATRKAVQMFQAINDIEIDGCVGESTYDLLMSENAKGMTLKRGLDATLFEEDVTKLQNRLIELGYMTDTATGRYGDTTIKAVTDFQTANALAADGIAGPDTLQLLYSDQALPKGSAAANPAPATTSPNTAASPDTAATPDTVTSPNP